MIVAVPIPELVSVIGPSFPFASVVPLVMLKLPSVVVKVMFKFGIALPLRSRA